MLDSSGQAPCDLVLARDLVAPAKLKLYFAQSLSNFRMPSDSAKARADARLQGVLLLLPGNEFDDGILKDVKRAGGAIVLPFSAVLGETGFRRSIAISKMRILLGACARMGCTAVVASLAKGESGLRNGRELEAFAAVIGMDGNRMKQSQAALAKLCEGGRI